VPAASWDVQTAIQWSCWKLAELTAKTTLLQVNMERSWHLLFEETAKVWLPLVSMHWKVECSMSWLRAAYLQLVPLSSLYSSLYPDVTHVINYPRPPPIFLHYKQLNTGWGPGNNSKSAPVHSKLVKEEKGMNFHSSHKNQSWVCTKMFVQMQLTNWEYTSSQHRKWVKEQIFTYTKIKSWLCTNMFIKRQLTL